jgi:protein-S-isoprenylcysteine O-methyltransferase Ste14
MNFIKRREISSYVLVFVQFGCLAGLLYTGPLIAHKPLGKCIEIFSLLLVIWALVAMSKSKVSVFPDLKQGAILIAKGPYKFIRHPMYLALILFSLSVVIDKPYYFRILIGLLLILNLLIKIEFEEKILIKEFKEYGNYIKVTRKLLPFIY